MRLFNIKQLCKIILFVFIASNEGFAASNNAVVLMYHRFGESKYPSTNIKTVQFTAHLDFIAENAYQVWPLQKIIDHMTAAIPLPDKVLAITVDDAYASVYTTAFPILKKRNLPFTLFVATDPVENAYSNYMSWEQLREMVEYGVTIGNHSKTHHHLVEKLTGETNSQWRARAHSEIKQAEQQIQRILGVKPTMFAYPYGEYSLALSEIVDELGYVGFGQQSGAMSNASNKLFLPRYPISEDYADLEGFSVKLASLALPVKNIEPLDAVTHVPVPVVKIQLAFIPKNKSQLQCYVSGQGLAEIRWLNDDTFQVHARAPIKSRRSRYNCTLPDITTSRYYWYSHLWIKPEIAEPEN